MPTSSSVRAPSSPGASRRLAAGLAALGLLFGLTSVAVAGPTPAADQGRQAPADVAESPTGLYIVQLNSPALALYGGGIDGLAPTAPSVTGDTRLDLGSDAAVAYRDYLRTEQDGVLARINALDGLADVSVADRYRLNVALNGFVVKLPSAAAATAVAQVDGVRSVEPDSFMDFVTDVGPEWIDAPTIWGAPDTETLKESGGLGTCVQEQQVPAATGRTAHTCGEGIVVGIIDTGINTGHPSFADIGGDGYDHTNPRGVFYGECLTDATLCNDKLIGAYDFTEECVLLDMCSPEDDNGHGTHTASTTAGNVLDATILSPTLSLTRTISGVAPHANIISYRACQTEISDPAGLLIGCELTNGAVVSALVAAIDQAVEDEVDVINFSIGGGPADPYEQVTDPAIPSISLAFLGANEAGVFASLSAGNSGPDELTVGYPSNAPWSMSVGATTHNRKFTNGVINMVSEGVEPPPDLFGVSFSCGYPQDPPMTDYGTECDADASLPEGTAPIVWAGDYELFDPSSTQGDCGNGPPAGANLESSIDPFPATVDFEGAIVICRRGTYARVDKAEQVAENGAGGFILINDSASGDSLVSDPYVIPGVHLTYDDGEVLLEWVQSGENPEDRQGAIQGTFPDETPANADIMASFSSRGPNEPLPDVIKPDIAAPGVDVLAAWINADDDDETTDFNIISGTSMAAPHNAGSAALLRALHADWTPDQVRSALMMTSFNYLPSRDGVHGLEEHDVLKEDAATPADPFDMGAGRVDLSRAGNAGLIMDETAANYEASDPAADGDPKTLNIPSMADDECAQTCSWTRTFQGTTADPMIWNVSTIAPEGVTLTVEPTIFTVQNNGDDVVDEGETASVTVTATITTPDAENWRFGQLVLSPGDLSVTGEVTPLLVDPQQVSPLHLPIAVLGTEEGTQQTESPAPTGSPVPTDGAPTCPPAAGPSASAEPTGAPPTATAEPEAAPQATGSAAACPTATASPAPTTATTSPTPRMRFIPDTAGEWASALGMTGSVVFLLGSLAILGAGQYRSRRKLQP